MVVVYEEEVVEVATNLLVGIHEGKEVEFRAIGEGGEGTGQLVGLDIGGYPQFGAHAFLLCRNALYLIQVLEHLGRHHGKGLGQVFHLVASTVVVLHREQEVVAAERLHAFGAEL